MAAGVVRYHHGGGNVMVADVHDRERIFRGADNALAAAIPAFGAFIAFALGAQQGKVLPYAIGAALSVLVLAALFRWPRRVRVVDGALEVSRPGGRRRSFRPADLVGVRFARAADWGVAPARVATVVFAGGALEVGKLRRPQATWDALEELIFEPRAQQIVEQLRDGKEVKVGPFALRRDGLQIGRVRARWDELDAIATRPEGYLIRLVDRPQDAILVAPGTISPVPLLATIAAAMVVEDRERDDEAEPRLGEPYRGDAVAPDKRPARAAELPRGMPATHPQLGEAMFGYFSSFFANLVVWLFTVFGFSFFGTIAAAVVLGEQHPVFVAGMIVMFTSCALALSLRYLRRGSGTSRGAGRSFAVYDGGIADRAGALRWRDVEVITLAATRTYVNGQYTDMSYGFHVVGKTDGRRCKFGMSGDGPIFEAYYAWFVESVLPRLVARDLARMEHGDAITYAGVVADKDGLRTERAAVKWEALRARVGDGKLDASGIPVDLNAPNARLLLAVIEARAAASPRP